MSEVSYNAEYLQKLKYVKIIFSGAGSDLCEVVTEVKHIGNELISVYVRSDKIIPWIALRKLQ